MSYLPPPPEQDYVALHTEMKTRNVIKGKKEIMQRGKKEQKKKTKEQRQKERQKDKLTKGLYEDPVPKRGSIRKYGHHHVVAPIQIIIEKNVPIP